MRRPAQQFFILVATAALLSSCDDASTETVVDVDGSLAAIAGATDLAAPSGLTVVPSTDQRLDLRWTDNSGNETGFEVLRSRPNTNGDYAVLVTTASNVVTFSDVSVQPGATYCYFVRAIRKSGPRIAWSESVGACGTAIVPPSNITAVASSSTRVTIGWRDNSTIETGYEVSRSSSGEAGPFYGLPRTGADAVSLTDDYVLALTRYCYRVQAVSASSLSTPTTVVCLTVPAPTTPPPSGYVVSATATGSSQVEITVAWTDPVLRAPAYRLYRSTDGGAQWEAVTLPGQYGKYWDTGRASEQPVCYRVVAYNDAGDAAPSNAACATPPAAPSNLAATLLDAATVRFTWSDDSSVEDGYEVWGYFTRGDCCPGDGGGCSSGIYEGDVLIATLPAGSTEYRHTAAETICGIVDYPFYSYFIVARKGTGTSSRSNEAILPFQSP